MKGKVRERWSKLTDDDVAFIAGRKNRLLGRLLTHYGLKKTEAEREIEAFLRSLEAIGVSELNSNLATFIRTVVILVVLALIITTRAEWQRPAEIPQKAIVFLVLSAIATGLSWVFYYRALQLGKASDVAPVDKLSVVFAMVLAWIFLGEPVTWKAVLGGLLVTAGALVLVLG